MEHIPTEINSIKRENHKKYVDHYNKYKKVPTPYGHTQMLCRRHGISWCVSENLSTETVQATRKKGDIFKDLLKEGRKIPQGHVSKDDTIKLS